MVASAYGLGTGYAFLCNRRGDESNVGETRCPSCTYQEAPVVRVALERPARCTTKMGMGKSVPADDGLASRHATCPRCRGLMVPMAADGFDDALLELSKWPGWRCINCGERIDPLIVANRRAKQNNTVTDAPPRCRWSGGKQVRRIRRNSPAKVPEKG